MIESDIQKAWIVRQGVSKFGRLKTDNGGNTVMCSDQHVIDCVVEDNELFVVGKGFVFDDIVINVHTGC